ncbi:G-protein coupled receptor 157-like [Lineus longissimus]|uniref:G-protein coupled receptor 157-like n=1 Tax=Lineus longissimus TaxID=88925 RepID=UPI00315DBB44
MAATMTTEMAMNTTATPQNFTIMTLTPVRFMPPVPLYILIVTAISCVLSLFGSFAIFWTFFKFQTLRTTSRKLLLYLTIADFFTAAGYLMGVIRYWVDYTSGSGAKEDQCPKADAVCVAQSYITTCSSLCSFFWMIVISAYFIIAVVKQDVEAANRMMVPSHVICWGLPVFLTSLALGFGVLGEDLSYTSGGWCWITACDLSNDVKLLWMLATGKFWEFVTYMVLIVNYLLLKYFIWKRMRYHSSLRRQGISVPRSGEQLSGNDTMFIFVPIILLVLRIWGSLKFLITISLSPSQGGDHEFESNKGIEVLTLFQGIGDSGQAFWNFVLFCLMTPEVRVAILASFRQQFSWLRVDSITSDTSTASEESVNSQTRRLVPSITEEVREEYNRERTALYHKQFSNYDSTSLG